jgi:hypothetical protein
MHAMKMTADTVGISGLDKTGWLSQSGFNQECWPMNENAYDDAVARDLQAKTMLQRERRPLKTSFLWLTFWTLTLIFSLIGFMFFLAGIMVAFADPQDAKLIIITVIWVVALLSGLAARIFFKKAVSLGYSAPTTASAEMEGVETKHRRFGWCLAAAVLLPFALESLYLFFSRWPSNHNTEFSDLAGSIISLLLGASFIVLLPIRLRWRLISVVLYVPLMLSMLSVHAFAFVVTVFHGR